MEIQTSLPDSCTMVVFGACGDLAKRKLIPALFNLIKLGLLPKIFNLIGYSRREFSDEEFRAKISTEYREFLSESALVDASSQEQWNKLISHASYVSGNFDEPGGFEKLKKVLPKGSSLFYFATPPEYFLPIAQNLHNAGLTNQVEGAWRRVIIEKPFGRDLESAKKLNLELKNILTEDQIFRIDHYLGKETVQNIMVLRFANGIFEPIWNRNFIESIDITVAETLGIGSRSDYYEKAGALRDMMPNHLFQIMSLIGMEPPSSFDANAIRDEKAKLVESIRPLAEADVLTYAIRGQYLHYREEKGVDPHSSTETYVALKLFVENWRWAGVPFVLKTGKCLANRISEVKIRFKKAPLQLFRQTGLSDLSANELYIQFQPEEQIALKFGAKIPGTKMKIAQVEMDFDYADSFGKIPSTGYETLIYDCMIGDATLFQRSDQIESAWAVVQPVLDVWNAIPPRQFPNYVEGSWGPGQEGDILPLRSVSPVRKLR